MNTQQSAAFRTMLLRWLPLGIMAAFACGLFLSPTRAATLWLLEENHPVEMLTFLFFVSAGILALLQCRTLNPLSLRLFFGLFGLFCIFVGMEEISWGQQLFGFSTPDALEKINRQGEITLHNIGPLQGRSELFRLCCGLAGLASCLMNRIPSLRAAASPKVLLPWFLVITVHALVDTADDFISVPHRMKYATQRLSELVEFLIAAAALTYILLKKRELQPAEPCA